MKKFFSLLLLVPCLSFAQELNLETAQRLSNHAREYAAKKSWKVSVAIVNSEGNLILFERGDGTYPGSIASATSKAQSSNSFQRPTSAFVEAVRGGKAGLLSAPGVVAIEGGVPIHLEGKHVGAIGVSGALSAQDEETALEALKILGKK